MEKLKFKKDAQQMPLTDDFWYMLTDGGYCIPEDFLEESDAKRVREAIDLIAQYEQEGIDNDFFEEC